MDYSEDYNNIKQNENKFYDDEVCDLCRLEQAEEGETLCYPCARAISE
jgi:hypothetical protein